MLYSKIDYSTLKSYECLNSCLYNYLYNEKVIIDKSEIFFYGEGFKLNYNDSKSYPIMSTSTFDSNFKFLSKSNIDYYMGAFEEKKQAFDFLRECIYHEYCIIIKVNSARLYYNSVFINSQAVSHFINPIGLDEKNEKVFISDGYIPSIPPAIYHDWVDLNAIISAWQDKKFNFICINPSSLRGSEEERIQKEARKEFKRDLKKYIIGNQDHTEGWLVFSKLLEELYEYLIEENVSFSEFAFNINYQFKMYGFFTIKKYILNYIKILHMPSEIIGKYEEVYNKWRLIDKYIIKVALSKKIVHLQELIDKVHTLSIEEINILKFILNY